MSTKNLAKTISVLEDGKLSVFLNSGQEVYIQPQIVVDTLDKIDSIIIRGEDKNHVDVDVTVSEIDGVAFSGTFAQLETALRELAKKANGLSLGGSSGTPVLAPDASTETEQLVIQTKQDTQISHSEKLLIGSTLDLTQDDGEEWAGFPFTLTSNIAISIWIDTLQYKFESDAVISKIEDLVEALQDAQSLLSFSKYSETSLLVSDGTETVDNTDIIALLSTTVELEYPKPGDAWAELPTVPLSAIQDLNERSKSIEAHLKSIDSTKPIVAPVNHSLELTYAGGAGGINEAELLLPVNPSRKAFYLQAFEFDIYVRFISAVTTPTERKGFIVYAGEDPFEMEPYKDGSVYKEEISIINVNDGEAPKYRYTEIND